MKALFIIVNHENHFNELLSEFKKADIHGGTILESQGLAQSMAEHNYDLGFSYFRMMLNQGRPFNKTIFLILSDEKIEIAKECVRNSVGNLNQENIGIMFTMPISDFEGLTK